MVHACSCHAYCVHQPCAESKNILCSLLSARQDTCNMSTSESMNWDHHVVLRRRFWQWQAGMLMFVVGNIANFVARGQAKAFSATMVVNKSVQVPAVHNAPLCIDADMTICVSCCAAFASQSLLTGLGSVQFVSNLLFVVLVLKEKVPLRCILATFLIVAGNVLLVVFGSKTSPKYTVSQLAALYRQDSMAAYMIMAYGGGIQSLASQSVSVLLRSSANMSSACMEQCILHCCLRSHVESSLCCLQCACRICQWHTCLSWLRPNYLFQVLSCSFAHMLACPSSSSKQNCVMQWSLLLSRCICTDNRQNA